MDLFEFFNNQTSDDDGINEKVLRATQKLNTEIENSNLPYIKDIGKHLISYLNLNTDFADFILIDGKSIKEGFEVTKKEAEKSMVDNCAVLDRDTVLNIVIEYFKQEV